MMCNPQDACNFTGFSSSLPRTGGLVNLSPAEALECLAQGAVLVDLREPYGTNFRVFAVAKLTGGMIDWYADGLPVRKDSEYELGGQCACKMKIRHGGNPLIKKRPYTEV